jgi:arsenate reductase
MDLLITVCDQAAGEACPVWPGHPARVHWTAPDPAAYMDDPAQAQQVIREVVELMRHRIARLVSLTFDNLSRQRLEAEARAIADASAPPPAAR